MPLGTETKPGAAWPSFLRQVPGFRSSNVVKAVLASVFYLFCVVGILIGVGEGAFGVWGFYLTCLLIGLLSVFLWTNRHSRRRLAALGLALAMTLVFGGWALASPLPGGVVSRGGLHANPTPKQVAAVPLQSTPTELPSTSPNAALPSLTPTPVPSPSPSPTPTLTPTPTPPPATAKPIPPPTQAPPPPPTQAPVDLCGAPGNPWNYNFCGGNVIKSPPANFCDYFNCIPSFWKSALGYVDQCVDGTYSHSGGRSGACSSHGGERRPLYSP